MMPPFLARHERFERVVSTNDVVRDWLAEGTAEVCLAVADEQTDGRGRSGRTWLAPRGAALLLSLGFRPTWLAPDRTWRLAAIVSLAMADAATQVAGLADGAIRLKWPNDLVVESDGLGLRKLGGVLGETEGLGTADPRVIIGIGVNTDWRAEDFPPELVGSMTSLRETAGGRPPAAGGRSPAAGGRAVETSELLAAFIERLGLRLDALRGGRFDASDWSSRQVTTGRTIRLERPEGSEIVRALGVDATTGALLVEDADAPNGQRQVLVGEVSHVRVVPAVAAGV